MAEVDVPLALPVEVPAHTTRIPSNPFFEGCITFFRSVTLPVNFEA